MHELNGLLEEIARTPVLLVASDFDGTIAPIVDDPLLAEADRESVVALKALSQMPQTHVAIISGRALADLAPRTREIEEIHLVGSHGSEFEAGFVAPLPVDVQEKLARLIEELQRIAGSDPGFIVEIKPAAAAFHYRKAPDGAARAAVDAVMSGPATWPGVYVRSGKKVIELSVVETNKGMAIQRLRQRLGATAVLFMGDDVTDEDVFRTLAGPDIGVKVGPGETAAKHHIPDTLGVARLLATVSERRATWIAGSHAVPIEQHAMLSDQRTIAIVDPRGRLSWMCLPRIDSSSLFSELLGGPSAGFFEIRPVDQERPVRQVYVPDTFILRTEWDGLTVVDYLDCAEGRAYQRAGRTDLVRVIEGRGRVRITLAPRIDFGRVQTRLRLADGGIEIEGTIDPIVLRAPGVEWQLTPEGQHQTAVAEVELQGKPIVLDLRYGTANLELDFTPESVRRERNARFWTGWSSTLSLPSVASDLVRRSALALRALCYGPTGAIAAAATTSLPEHAGGVRNWDYRFCWPRDAAMSAHALARLGAHGPAMKFLDWLLGIIERGEDSGMLRPVYTVTGGHLGSEGEIRELAGYRGSRPVRVGNAAAQQIQLDVFGPIAELLALLAERGAALSTEHWRMLDALVAAVANRWREPDHGIWEIRASRQHYVHSKVMCWQTVDRALQVARYLGKKRPDWEELRKTIAEDVLTHGWRQECNAFGATYDHCLADAATLVVGLSGLVAPDDPRWLGTIAYVERELRNGAVVYRYRYDDGLPGIEGGFLICTAWLIEAYALSGRIDEARELFEAYCKFAGPTGLFPEEYDPDSRQSLGNYPQAYTHVGLINCALRLARTG